MKPGRTVITQSLQIFTIVTITVLLVLILINLKSYVGLSVYEQTEAIDCDVNESWNLTETLVRAGGTEGSLDFVIQEEFEFNPEIKNAKGEQMDYDIRFESADTGCVGTSKEIRKNQKNLLTVREGRYDIEISLQKLTNLLFRPGPISFS